MTTEVALILAGGMVLAVLAFKQARFVIFAAILCGCVYATTTTGQPWWLLAAACVILMALSE